MLSGVADPGWYCPDPYLEKNRIRVVIRLDSKLGKNRIRVEIDRIQTSRKTGSGSKLTGSNPGEKTDPGWDWPYRPENNSGYAPREKKLRMRLSWSTFEMKLTGSRFDSPDPDPRLKPNPDPALLKPSPNSSLYKLAEEPRHTQTCSTPNF